jgi:DNA repair protein RadD
MERERILSDFRKGSLRWCVNVDVLTTGFDSPRIDAIAVLRATMSPGLFAQIVGRGLRRHDEKTDCLILDFGENIKRHGSLDDPNYGRVSVGRAAGDSPAIENNGRGKPCPNCGLEVAARTAICPECGFAFPANHGTAADESSSITGKQPPEEWVLQSVAWGKHTKKSDPDALPTLRIDYACQPVEGAGNLTGKRISEWICIEHSGFAGTKAGLWWQQRSECEMPSFVDDAVELLDRGVCRHAAKLWTEREGKFYRIVRVEFVDEIPTEEEWDEEEVFHEFSGVDGDVPF